MKKIVVISLVSLITAVVLLTLFSTGFFTSAVAADPDLPPRPLPPSPGSPNLDFGPNIQGGFIILVPNQAGTIDKNLWTKVQWQSNGEWFDVDGWEGHFNHETQVLWWVASEHLGAGPFRWVVYASQSSDRMVAASDSFFLPDNHNQNIQVNIPLPMVTITEDTTPETVTSKVVNSNLLRGGMIILTMSENGTPMVVTESDNYWTKVQWQSGAAWVDVEGWQGGFTSDSEVAWWVSGDHLGNGPFRWVLYKDGRVLITSDPFMLPTSRIEDVWVNFDVK